jgi:uncharacterized protein (DUF427 family)
MKAVWNNEVLASSDATVVVEGNHYFPMTTLNTQFFINSDKQTTCAWKGVAHYYDVSVNGALNESAAWFYPTPKQEASQIKNYVAFWKGVKVSND